VLRRRTAKRRWRLPLQIALAEIERIDAEKPIEIDLVSIDEMDPDLYAASCGKLGPISTNAQSCHDSRNGIIALRKTMQLAEAQNKKIGYFYTLEHDCIQLPYFLKVATAMGLPLLDADACGRSVPTLGNILPCVYGHPISPFVYASAFGESIVIETPDPCDTKTMETIGRSIVVGYDNMLIGYCMPPLSKADCQECLVAGSPSSLQATGRALIEAKANGTDPAQAVLSTVEGKFICRGEIKALELECRDDFDFGRTVIAGDDGSTYTLLVQNENLAAFKDDEPILTSPTPWA
jgi:DUF917 family protein